MATDNAPDVPTTALLRNLITALEDKKADQLTVLHVGGISNITDYLVLATGNSEPHLRALRIEAEKILDAAKVPIAGMEQGGFGSGWTVVDAYQIMVHLFTAEQRGNYALEKLWKDAPEVNLKTLAAKPAAKSKAKVTKVKAAEPVKAKATKAKPTKTKPAAKVVAKPAAKPSAKGKSSAKKASAPKPAAAAKKKPVPKKK